MIKRVRYLTIPAPDNSNNWKLKNAPDELQFKIMKNKIREKSNNYWRYLSEKDIKSYNAVENVVLRKYE